MVLLSTPLRRYTCQSVNRTGHTHIDILKIDVEGWEFDTLSAMIKSYLAAGRPLPFGQLQLEIHVWNKRFPEFLSWWQMLESAGLRPFMTEVGIAGFGWWQRALIILAPSRTSCTKTTTRSPTQTWRRYAVHRPRSIVTYEPF